jgi:hypothetical protein
MSNTHDPESHSHIHQLIAQHFAGRATPEAQHEMRAHLVACSACRSVYERRWLFAQLDPRALPTEERIAIGLGMRAPTWSLRPGPWVTAVAAVGVLALAAVSSERMSVSRATEQDVQARGPTQTALRAECFWIYQFDAKGDPSHYADDDAVRYQELFRLLGARSYVLSRLDDNTRRMYGSVTVMPPRLTQLQAAFDALRGDIARARASGVRTVLYVVYAGHGSIDDSAWQLTLEDQHLRGSELLSLIAGADADRSHVIVDACHAYMLALPRGPGGARKPLGGFVELEAARRAGRIGFLLSSSMSGESHEWAWLRSGRVQS